MGWILVYDATRWAGIQVWLQALLTGGRLVVPASREPDTILRAIVDTEATERFPIYTRGNADEVGPDPFTPLNWTLTWEQGIVPGTARHAHRGAPEANRRRFHQIDHLCVELDRFEAGQRP